MPGPSLGDHREEERHFVERMGLLMEQRGIPRMAGRVLGRLMVSVPPHQTAGELAEYLQASKGSISGATQLLERSGLIERFTLPGERRDYFRMRQDVWFQLTQQGLAVLNAYRAAAEEGLGLLAHERPEMRRRLEELKELCDFYEQEIPALVERWERFREKRRQVTGDGR